jgi:sortase (surface protein transpeptidase)
MRQYDEGVFVSPVKPQSRWFFGFLLIGGIALAIGFFAFILLAISEPYTVKRQVVDSLQGETSVHRQAQRTVELPGQLVIPSIGVRAQVQLLGLADNGSGEMDVPDNFTDVGWYKHGPRPGTVGSAVIVGHLNGKNVPEAVFFALGDLGIGDTVDVVAEDGATLTFIVVQLRTYPYDAPTDEVFVSTDGKVRLNLITCAGDWLQKENIYNKRTVVFTELVSQTQ